LVEREKERKGVRNLLRPKKVPDAFPGRRVDRGTTDPTALGVAEENAEKLRERLSTAGIALAE